MKSSRDLLVGGVLAFALFGAGPVQATTYYLNNTFSGNTNPGCTGPGHSCLTADFSQTAAQAAANTVRLTLDAFLAPGEFISQFYFNFDPTLDLSKLAVTYRDSPISTDTPAGNTANPTATKSANNESPSVGSAGNFDVLLSWTTSNSPTNGPSRFTGTEISIWDLVFSGKDALNHLIPITPADFNFESCTRSGGSPSTRTCGAPFFFYVADHIQGLPNGASIKQSGVDPPAPVPLPATLPLFASGLAGLGWLSRRRKQREVAAA